jgi:uncharacterized protein YkwD
MPLTDSKPAPPAGFENFMFDAEPVDHHQIQAAVLEEFNGLRAQASLPPLASRQPKN